MNEIELMNLDAKRIRAIQKEMKENKKISLAEVSYILKMIYQGVIAKPETSFFEYCGELKEQTHAILKERGFKVTEHGTSDDNIIYTISW